MSFATRSDRKELLDADHIPFADIERNMYELDVINTRLGGHRITCNGIAVFLKDATTNAPLSVAEIGCGGGDNLAAVKKYLAGKGVEARLTGIDLKEACIRYAQSRTQDNTTWICSDYAQVCLPDKKPDVLFSSLFCHHFTDDQLVAQLGWMQANARLGFFINDLHRHPLAYYTIKLLTAMFSKSYLVRNDAPLSVQRGFKKSEWENILARASIKNYTIKWQWAFRYLISVRNEQQPNI